MIPTAGEIDVHCIESLLAEALRVGCALRFCA